MPTYVYRYTSPSPPLRRGVEVIILQQFRCLLMNIELTRNANYIPKIPPTIFHTVFIDSFDDCRPY
jgi:hypothetical protein